MKGSLKNRRESTAVSKRENKPTQNPTSNKIEKEKEKQTVDLTIRYFHLQKPYTDLRMKAKLSNQDLHQNRLQSPHAEHMLN